MRIIAAHTEGYGEFKEFVKDFTLKKAEETAGLAPEQILELAGWIHEANGCPSGGPWA